MESDVTDCIVTTTKSGWNRPDTVEGGKRMRSHRAAWIRAYGAIPSGMCVCHKCDNPQCVNPEHLFLGSHTDNMRDMWAKGRARPHKYERGAKHPRPKAKLTEETAIYAMVRLLAGESQKSVAASFGVDQSCISHLWRGHTWSHCFQEGGLL
jgi:HNH endonuclease